MSDEQLLAIVTALILPTVQKDMGKDAQDLLDVIQEAVSYAADIVENVQAQMEAPDDNPDEEEKVEVIPPRRRHV